MSRGIQSSCYAMAVLFLSPWALTPAVAQTGRYDYGFCYGVAGNPRANNVTRVFVLGASSGDLRAEFTNALFQKYQGNFSRDAGCRMYPTAAEAEQARRQLVDQGRSMSAPIVAIDWIPKGATALSAAAPAPGAAVKPDAPATSTAGASPGASAAPAAVTQKTYQCWMNSFGSNYITPAFASSREYYALNADWRAYITNLHPPSGVSQIGCMEMDPKQAASNLAQAGRTRLDWKE